MRRTSVSLLSLLVLLVGISVVRAQDYPRLTLRFGHFTPSTPPHAQVDQWFAAELTKRTGGRITMEIYWAEAVGKARELINLTAQGAVDVSAVPASYFPAQFPFLAAPNSLPLTMASAREAQTVMHTLWQETPLMQEEARRANVWPLFFHVLNPYHLLCTKPIRTLEDLKGKKMRSWGEDIPRVWQAVGAVPVTVLPGEFYESLQRGSVDCMLLSWDLLVAFKLHEVAKYASTISFGAIVSNPQWYGLKKWENLPPNVKKLLTDLAEEAKPLDLAKVEDAERKALETMKASGVEMIAFPDQAKFEKLLPDFLADWTTRMEKLGKGPEAAAMANRWRQIRSQSR
jgi:TRAP-type C4-dicarboxylate transport system substrate-binding protein